MLCFGRYFFFQAEDGIRDHCVTGVQTCALPILVARVVLFAAVTDSIGTQSVPWVASHMTPSDRYYGLEIGRASCRERVKIREGAVCLEQKEGECFVTCRFPRLGSRNSLAGVHVT